MFKLPSVVYIKAATIKAQSPTTYVVLISGACTPDLAQLAHMHGADDSLPKPFQIEAIKQIARAVLA